MLLALAAVHALAVGQLDAPRRLEELEGRHHIPKVEARSEPEQPDAGLAPAVVRDLAVARTQERIRVDGALNDAAWSKVAPVGGFSSWRSKPRGQPAAATTEVQVTYDTENLYVAFRCKNQPGDPILTGAPATENDMLGMEYVLVAVDANHDRASYKAFLVSRGGYRADFDATGTNESRDKWKVNWEWRGEWTASTAAEAEGWTAEVAIPWTTLRVPKHEEDYVVGIDFVRGVPSDYSEWALSPPGYRLPKPTHFGQMTVKGGIDPGEYVYLAPSVAGTWQQQPTKLPLLRNFASTSGAFGNYAGLFGRVQLPGPVEVDVTANPDFLGIPPDPALSATDRFELYYPEQRDFFLENRASLEMGTRDYQLFYSRRIGINADLSEAPIIYGAKAHLLAGNTEASVLNVATGDVSAIHIANAYTVARVQQTFQEGDRVGALFMDRSQPSAIDQYRAYGADGQLTFFNQQLRLSGFMARSDTAGAPSGITGNVNASWTSENFYLRSSFLQVDDTFDPQMGYFILTGIRRLELVPSYTALVDSDLVNRIVFGVNMSRTLTLADTPLIDRVVVRCLASFSNSAALGVIATRSVDTVQTDFTLAGGRFNIPPGSYVSNLVDVFFDLPPGVVSGGVEYEEGTFWGGYERTPMVTAQVRWSILNLLLRYQLTYLRLPDASEILGHHTVAQVVVAFTSDLRTSLYFDVNTLDPGAVGELVTSYTFGHLSTVLLVVGERASTLGSWVHNSDIQVALKFSYGFRPF